MVSASEQGKLPGQEGPIRLHYFNGQGRAELVRLLFHYSKIEYEDRRFVPGEWENLKANDPIFSYGQAPVLEFNGKAYNQSGAISRFVARKLGFYPESPEDQLEIDVLINNCNDVSEAAGKAIFAAPDKKEELIKAYVEGPGSKFLKFIDDRLAAKENKNYIVGDKISYPDFFFYVFYTSLAKGYLLKQLGPVVFNFPHAKRYFDFLRAHEFNLYARQVNDKSNGLSVEERSLINEIYDYWFPVADTNSKMEKALVDKWYMGGEKVDNECKAYLEHVEKAAKGEYDHWAKEPYGRLALIVLLDQFSRNIFRKQGRAFAQDPKAVQLTKEGIEKGDLYNYGHLERSFFLMPLMHSENKEDHVLAVEMFQLQNDLAEKLYPECASTGQIEFEAKHKAIVDQFGRYPHRNEVLGRESTPEEVEYLKTADRFGQ